MAASSKSKWAKFQGKLPDAPASDMTSAAQPGFLAKVDDKKVKLAGLSFPELQAKLLECNQEYDDLKAREKELNVDFEALGQLILGHFRRQGVTNVKGLEDKTFYTHVEPLVSVKAGLKDQAEAWAEADPARHYLFSLHPQSLASWVKDRLDKLEDEKTEDDKIPEFFSVMLKTSIRVR
jgi:hypothetical protein